MQIAADLLRAITRDPFLYSKPQRIRFWDRAIRVGNAVWGACQLAGLSAAWRVSGYMMQPYSRPPFAIREEF
jgi:hypothetical protein